MGILQLQGRFCRLLQTIVSWSRCGSLVAALQELLYSNPYLSNGAVLLGYVLPCFYCCLHVTVVMHCLVDTVVCMSQLLCIALLILLHACTGCKLDKQSSQYINSCDRTYAQAYVYYCIYSLKLFIREVSWVLTCPLHLDVCMREGAWRYLQSAVQFNPCEWMLPTRLTVWCPCIDLRTYKGRRQCSNRSWSMVWSAEVLLLSIS